MDQVLSTGNIKEGIPYFKVQIEVVERYYGADDARVAN